MTEDIVVLTTVYDPLEAEIIKAKLGREGIVARLSKEAVGRVYQVNVDGLGAIDVYVSSSEAERARALLGL